MEKVMTWREWRRRVGLETRFGETQLRRPWAAAAKVPGEQEPYVPRLDADLIGDWR